MKRILYKIAVFSFAAIVSSSCHEKLDKELADLKLDVEELEDYVSGLNRNYAALAEVVEALEQKDFIKNIEQKEDGSYKISFVSGKEISLTDGENGEKPVVGIKYDSDIGTYFWTIREGEQGVEMWIYDATGKRIRATAVTPKFRVTDGHFEYTYDEKNWLVLGVSVGESGSSVFSNVSAQDYFVTFTLTDGTVFQIPTKQGFDELSARCDTINMNIIAYHEILTSLDSNMFIKSVTKVEEAGKTVGYDIVLESGNKLILRSGKDSSEEVELGTMFDINLWAPCWAYRMSGEVDFKYILYEGKKLPVEPEDANPVIGVKDSAGVFYFTITIGQGESQMMRDSLGVPVRANPVRFFENVEEVSGAIKLTLSTFGLEQKTVLLSRQMDWTPSLILKDTTSGADFFKVKIGQQRSFVAVVDSIPQGEISHFKYELVSSALDSAYVKEVTIATDTIKRDSGKWAINNKITFVSSSSAIAGKKTRVAVFLSWDNHTTMKVAEFLNE